MTTNAKLVSPQPQLISSYASTPISGVSTAVPVPSGAPSFRPVPQFSPLQNYPPPGVSAPPTPMMPYQLPPGQAPNPALRPFAPVPNGYAAMPGIGAPGTMPLPGGLFHLFYLTPYIRLFVYLLEMYGTSCFVNFQTLWFDCFYNISYRPIV